MLKRYSDAKAKYNIIQTKVAQYIKSFCINYLHAG